MTWLRETAYLLRRRVQMMFRLRDELGAGWLESWRLSGLNQRVMVQLMHELTVERLQAALFERDVLADLELLPEVGA